MSSTLHVDDGVEAVVGHGVGEQVFQSVSADDAATVIHDGEALVRVSVVAEHRLDIVIVELIVLEQ